MDECQFAVLYVTGFALMAFSLVVPLVSLATTLTTDVFGVSAPGHAFEIQLVAAACATAYVASWFWVRGYFDAPYEGADTDA